MEKFFSAFNWSSILTGIIMFFVGTFTNHFLDERKFKQSKLHEKRSEIIERLNKKYIDAMGKIKYSLYLEQLSPDDLSEKKHQAFNTFQDFSGDFKESLIFLPNNFNQILKVIEPFEWALSVWEDSENLNLDNPTVAESLKKSKLVIEIAVDKLTSSLNEQFKKTLQ